LRIALIGREADHRLVYPATLGSLGDAAASLGLNLEVHFFAPVSLSTGLHSQAFQGVVLPGGSSMAAVNGQIRVAEDTLARGQPTLGLCLGMQSMMTAAVRRSPGFESAIPAEVAPMKPAQLCSLCRWPSSLRRIPFFLRAYPRRYPRNALQPSLLL
jgi:CTP synthase (UTP-ammonia lyase)